MPNKVKDMTFYEILYNYQLLYEEELEEMFNTTAFDTAIKEKLELIYLIKMIRNIEYYEINKKRNESY